MVARAVVLALWRLRQQDYSKASLDCLVKSAGDSERRTYTWMTSDTKFLFFLYPKCPEFLFPMLSTILQAKYVLISLK